MTKDRTVAAAGLITVYAMVIGFTDNFVRVIAAEGGLWQFHATRSVMAWGILLVLILFILARVFRHGAAMREDLEGTV